MRGRQTALNGQPAGYQITTKKGLEIIQAFFCFFPIFTRGTLFRHPEYFADLIRCCPQDSYEKVIADPQGIEAISHYQ